MKRQVHQGGKDKQQHTFCPLVRPEESVPKCTPPVDSDFFGTLSGMMEFENIEINIHLSTKGLQAEQIDELLHPGGNYVKEHFQDPRNKNSYHPGQGIRILEENYDDTMFQYVQQVAV